MKRNFILSIGLFVLAFGFMFNSNAQCPNDNIPFYFWDLSDEGETASTTCIFGGEYASLNVIEGASYEISTCGSSFDTQVTLYDAFTGAVVGYNDDACGLQSIVNFTAASTGTVNLLVDRYNCQDEFSCAQMTATLVSLPGGPQPCDNPQAMVCGSPLSFDLADGAGSYNPTDGPWGTPGNEAVFSFTPDVNGSYAISVSNDEYYVDLFYQAATCEAEGWLYVDDVLSAATNSVDLTGGVTYYFLLDDENTSQSTGVIEVICPTEASNPCDDLTVMNCGEEYNWSTGAGEGTLNPESGPWGTPGQEAVFAYTPDSDGSYLIEMTNVGYYSDLFIGFSCTSTETAIVDFTLNMFDSWGDGWNGNAITILADGVPVLENATIGSGSSGSETFSAAEGAVLTATWTTGSFTSEVSFEIADASGSVVAGGDFGNTIDYTIPDSSVPQASFTLNLLDSWGDGWNGNAITILADGVPVLTNATLGSGSSGSETFSAPEGAVLTATWTTGSFTSEVSFELVDASGTIVAGGDFGNTIDYTIPVVTVVEGDEWIYIDDVFSASNITIELTGGVTYYFLIDDEDTSPSNGTLTVSCPCIPPAGGIDGSFAYDGDFVISGTTDGACNDCDLRTSQDRIYEISVPCAGTYNFSTCGGASWDTYLYLTTAPCGGETIALNDDACGLQSSVTAALAPGTYYVAVEAFSSFSFGEFDLAVSGTYDTPVIGAISGAGEVCAGTQGEAYTVSGAFDSFDWSTSMDATATGDGESASVDFGTNSGSISVTGTNACGSNTASINVTVNSTPTYDLSSEDALCNGDDNGSITVNTTEGSAPFTYTINGESVTESLVVDVNASDNYIGYMNVFDNPADPCCGGGYIFGSPWALPDVLSTLDAGANTITLQPNFNTYNAADPFWSDGNEGGNKIMEANTYLENDVWNGQDLRFSGSVVSNTIDDGYVVQYFIKALNPANGFQDALGGSATIEIPASGDFSVSVPASSLTDGLIIQVGFSVTGLNANPVNADALGSVVVTGGSLVNGAYTFDGLTAGDYTIGLSDNNGCVAEVQTVTISEPDVLTASSSAPEILCNGETTDVTINVSGGTEPYSYSSGGSSSSLIISGVLDGPLSGGTPKAIEFYAISAISDLSEYGFGSANNGGGSDGQEFTFPAVSLPAGTHITVSSESDQFTVFIGTSSTYTSFAAGINGDDAIELFQGGAVIDVFGDINIDGSGQAWDYTDGWAYRNSGSQVNGGTWDISEWNFSGSNALDGESSNASASIPFPIGTFASSSESPSQTSNVFAGLPAGDYSYTITDANGCSATTSITLTEPDVLEADITAGEILCNGGSTTITVNATGGTTPYVYGIGESQSSLIISGVIDGPLSGGIPKAVEFYAINDITDLSSYGFGSANNGGGSDGEEFTFPSISVTAGSFITISSELPQFLSFFGTSSDYASSASNINGDDAIELFQNGVVVDVFGDINTDGSGQPWEYLDGWAYRISGSASNGGVWDISQWTFSGANALDGESSNALASVPFPISSFSAPSGSGVSQTSPIFDDIVAGSYNVRVLDDNGCIYTEIITIDEPTLLVPSSTSGEILCNGGTTTVTVTAIGGTPPYVGTGDYVVTAGTYTYDVTDANGCTYSTTITVDEPPLLEVSLDGCGLVYLGAGADYACAEIMSTVFGGTPGYTFEWSNTETTEGITVCPDSTSTYTLAVTDMNGCVTTVDWQVEVLDIACTPGGSSSSSQCSSSSSNSESGSSSQASSVEIVDPWNVQSGSGPSCSSSHGSSSASNSGSGSSSNSGSSSSCHLSSYSSLGSAFSSSGSGSNSGSSELCAAYGGSKSGKKRGKVLMCFEGVTYCVNAKNIDKKLNCGYSLGPCDAQQTEACNNSTATEEPVSCVCDGKIESITVRWVGPSFSSANVHAKKNCNILLAAVTDLMTGDEFTINASDAGLAYLRKDTYFEWAGVNRYKIPTNCCDNPVGQNFFPFEVIGWTDTEGNTCSVNSQASADAGEINDEDAITGIDGAMIKQYPNPASNNATFEFSVTEDQNVSVNILNINGQLVGTIYSGSVRANEVNKLDYSLMTLQSGIYYVHLNTPNGVLKKKFVVLK